jgi:hypothetical protein
VRRLPAIALSAPKLKHLLEEDGHSCVNCLTVRDFAEELCKQRSHFTLQWLQVHADVDDAANTGFAAKLRPAVSNLWNFFFDASSTDADEDGTVLSAL